jgi:hypothetical protein
MHVEHNFDIMDEIENHLISRLWC